MIATRTYKVGVAGLGAIGLPVVTAISAGIPGLVLEAIVARNPARTDARLAGIDVARTTFAGLAERCDIIVEAMPRALFRDVAVPALERGRIFIPLSVGALLDETDLIETAARTGGKIVVPSGAIGALDAVRAAAQGNITSATIETRKPPLSLQGAPYLIERGIDVSRIDTPTIVFDGTALDGARGFPASVNVAAALSLAGIGPRRTRLRLWADPGVTRNIHTIQIESDSARITFQIENYPTQNPKTGKITPLSVIATLRDLAAPLRFGS